MMLSGEMALGALIVLAVAAAGQAAGDGGELVRNVDFAATGEDGLPAEWAPWTPVWTPAACRLQRTEGGLRVDAPGGGRAVGGATQELRGVRPGQAYAVEATCELRGIASPLRSVLVRLEWLKGERPLHPAGRLVRGPMLDGATTRFRDVLVAPREADGARVSLEVKWPGDGSVLWRRVSVRPAAAPTPRTVKLGAVYLVPRNSTPQKNLDLWCQQIDAAGRLGLDAVCLGEAITLVGTGKTIADVAEPIPGPATRRLGEAARRNRLYVVAGLNERDGQTCYNTAVLLDRQGKLACTYRKVHLPREEWKQGVTPGASYPVCETDFGTGAIQICYDWFFPEAARAFALAGAEVLFAPTWGNTRP
ncbi:MAG: carbon-nitrogen hydrolase family protein, partial [bacterium]